MMEEKLGNYNGEFITQERNRLVFLSAEFFFKFDGKNLQCLNILSFAWLFFSW